MTAESPHDSLVTVSNCLVTALAELSEVVLAKALNSPLLLKMSLDDDWPQPFVHHHIVLPTFQSAAVSQPPSRVTMWFKLTVSNTCRVNVLYINTNLYPSFSIRSTLSPFPGPCLSNLFSPSQAECRGKSPKPSNSITTRVV